MSTSDDDSDIVPSRSRKKKKARKLNDLSATEDEDDSDEDFKGASTSASDSEDDEEAASESGSSFVVDDDSDSDVIDVRPARKKAPSPTVTRRSTRNSRRKNFKMRKFLFIPPESLSGFKRFALAQLTRATLRTKKVRKATTIPGSGSAETSRGMSREIRAATLRGAVPKRRNAAETNRFQYGRLPKPSPKPRRPLRCGSRPPGDAEGHPEDAEKAIPTTNPSAPMSASRRSRNRHGRLLPPKMTTTAITSSGGVRVDVKSATKSSSVPAKVRTRAATRRTSAEELHPHGEPLEVEWQLVVAEGAGRRLLNRRGCSWHPRIRRWKTIPVSPDPRGRTRSTLPAPRRQPPPLPPSTHPPATIATYRTMCFRQRSPMRISCPYPPCCLTIKIRRMFPELFLLWAWSKTTCHRPSCHPHPSFRLTFR